MTLICSSIALSLQSFDVLVVVALCHASLDADMAHDIVALDGMSILVDVATMLQSNETMNSIYALYSLEILRNLCFIDAGAMAVSAAFIQDLWTMITTGDHDPERQIIGAEILTNIASFAPTRVEASQTQISALLSLFFALHHQSDAGSSVNLQVALVDLLCNLCMDAAYCLVTIYELDERRPRNHQRHSGAVYFVDLTEHTADASLRQSMEAFAHNVSWSDPAGKRTIQKLGLSSFMNTFASEPAISN